MTRFFKWAGIVLLVLALPLVVALGLLLARPEASLTWLLRTTADMEYSAASTGISLWPVAIDLQQAEIKPVGGETLLQLDSGSLRFHLWRAITSAPSIWSLEADNVTFNVPETEAPAQASEQVASESAASDQAGSLDLALPLAFSRLAIDSLTIKPADGDAISLSFSFERQPAAGGTLQTGESAMDTVATKITLHQPNRTDFAVDGTLRYRLGSTNQLELRIPTLDLNPLLEEGEASDAKPEPAVAMADPNAPAATSLTEPPMDWSWLPSLGNLNLLLKIDELQAAEHHLAMFSGVLATDTSRLQLTDLSGQYQMLGDDQQVVIEQAFKGKLVIKPLSLETQGADANIELEMNGDHFQFGAKGIANLNAQQGNELALNLGVSDFKIAGDLLNKDFAPLTPFSLAANLATADHSIALSKLQLDAGANNLSGSLELGLAADPAKGVLGLNRITANLTAKQLNLQPLEDLQPASGEPATTATVADTSTDGAAADDASADQTVKLFSSDPLPLESLGNFSADVSLSAEQLKIFEAVFTEFSLLANSENNRLRVTPSAKFGGGGFGGSFSLAPKTNTADLAVEFTLTDINLEAFELVSREELTGGKTDLELTINSSGASSAALAANSKGLLLLTVVDAVVQNDTFELAGSDLIMEALSKLNPFGKTDPTTELNCALVKFEGEDGVWSTKNQLVIETEKMEIVGTGKIDLNDETLDIGITPSAKGGVGVNVGSLVKFLKMGGPLTNPRPQADAAGLLKSGVAIGAAASTGGLSILADGLAKRVLNAGDACTKARKPKNPS